jgi:polysaccharide biosynthesis protein PslH
LKVSHNRTAADGKPRLLVLSHVLPFPRTAGQQQRVYYTLRAAREAFHITFATVADPASAGSTREALLAMCDDVVLWPTAYGRSVLGQTAHRAASCLYSARTGLRRSNYAIGRVEFSPSRIRALLQRASFDCALFEYWHAVECVPVFREAGVPCVLDMHDILWQSYARVLEPHSGLLGPWKRWALRKYRAAEARAWNAFDAVIAINREEERVVTNSVSRTVKVLYAAMGTDLERWRYSPEPATPPRLAYYGSFASAQNQRCATRCMTEIMPRIWSRVPNAEFWIVGSNPPEALKRLAADPRVHVTGYVADVQRVLRTMTTVLCPWIGTFGFRSRLVEVLALGVPAVVSPDAVSGMELRDGEGVLIGVTEIDQAERALRLVGDPGFAREQGRLGRARVEQVFSLQNTYGTLVTDLESWLATTPPVPSALRSDWRRWRSA